MVTAAVPGRARTVTRLICASVSKVEGSVMDQLFEVRDALEQRPAPARVHAALMHASGWFVLWLEGPAAEVEAERERAAQDSRNANQIVIHHSTGPALLDESFVAAAVQGTDTPAAFARRIHRIRDDHKRGLDRGPDQAWKLLQSPCMLAHAPGEWRRPQRLVAMVAADDMPSVETLRKLGDRFDTPVVYQRFAGPKSRTIDSGVAYVDIANGAQVHRVRLLSRRALARPMLRRCLGGADAFVVLVGQRPSATVSLASTVATAVRSLPPAVVIYLVASTGAIALSFAQLLQQSVGSALVQRLVAMPDDRLVDIVLGMAQQDQPADAREAA